MLVWEVLVDRVRRSVGWLRCPWRRSFAAFAVFAALIPGPTIGATYEFEGPYSVRVVRQGLAIEITGTFSWALPQQVGATLAGAPDARIVYLDSPGGHIKSALEVADLLHARNLDTYVRRSCASACTIAFLAGHQRFLGATARLGFHQAHGPDGSSADANLLLRLAYQRLSVPPAFIAHVLRTPPQELWVPDSIELRGAGIVTDIAPEGALTISGP